MRGSIRLAKKSALRLFFRVSLKTPQQKLGQEGEKIAENFLRAKGFKILERNFKTPRWGELDLVTVNGDTLVFVEVKTRRGEQMTSPEESITPRKLTALKRAAYFYKLHNPDTPKALRLDVVIVEFLKQEPVIRYYKNLEI